MKVIPGEVTEGAEALEQASEGEPILAVLKTGSDHYGVMIMPLPGGGAMSLHDWAHVVESIKGTIAIYLRIDPEEIGDLLEKELQECQLSSSAASSSH